MQLLGFRSDANGCGSLDERRYCEAALFRKCGFCTVALRTRNKHDVRQEDEEGGCVFHGVVRRSAFPEHTPLWYTLRVNGGFGLLLRQFRGTDELAFGIHQFREVGTWGQAGWTPRDLSGPIR